MKVKKILSCLLAVSMIFTAVCFPVSAAENIPAERTITLSPEKTQVSTKEEFTIEINISGVEALGARWELNYDEEYFRFVSADFKTATNQKLDEPLSPEIMSVTGILEETAAIYTFQALDNSTEGGDEEAFTLSSVDIRTVEDVWLGTDVTDYIITNDTNVAITLRSIEGVTVNFDNKDVTNNIEHDYDAQSHTVSVKADTQDVNISYTYNGETQSEPFEFEDAGEYTIDYSITKDGYEPINDIITLIINKADFTNVVEMFDTTVIDGSYTYGFDGEEHTFSISSVNCIGNPEITYSYEITGESAGIASSEPKMKDAKEYVINYTISADNHNDYEGQTTITITKAEISDVVIMYDDEDITASLTQNNNVYEVTYDGEEHAGYIDSVALVGNVDWACNYSYSIGDGAFTEFGSGPIIKEAGKYVIKYAVTADNHNDAAGEFTVIVNTADFTSVPVILGTQDITGELDDNKYQFSYDGEAHEFSVGPVTTVDGTDATVTYSYKYNGGEKTDGAPSIKAAGNYEITYTVEADNHTKIEKTITITLDKPDYVVEVKFGEGSDYSAGKKLVLVYTHAKDVSFTYAGEQMVDVSNKPADTAYKYKGTGDHKYVYAWIGNAFPETGTTEEENLSPYEELVNVDYTNIPADGIDYTNPLDINNVNETDGLAVGWNDIMAAYSTVEGNAYTFTYQIKGAIKADVDGDRIPHSADVYPILKEVYPAN